MQLKLVANYMKNRMLLTQFEFYNYFWKENACQMIWWRPMTNIDIPIVQMLFKINSQKLSLVFSRKMKFLIPAL